jgi:hypothetical protein
MVAEELQDRLDALPALRAAAARRVDFAGARAAGRGGSLFQLPICQRVAKANVHEEVHPTSLARLLPCLQMTRKRRWHHIAAWLARVDFPPGSEKQ